MNKQRERLVELMCNAPKKEVTYFGRSCGKTYRTVEEIADYILADGWMRPPCKAGETVWVISQWYKYTKPEIESRKILSVQIYKNGDIQYHYKDGCFWQGHIGKTVFLSREEAEAKLVTDTNVGSKKEEGVE